MQSTLIRSDLHFSNFCARCLLVGNKVKIISQLTSKDSKFTAKEYLRCEEASSPLKLKLKKADLIATYKGKYTDSLCRGCGSHEGYIECLLDFPNFYQIPKMEKTCFVTNKAKVLKKQQKTKNI